MPASSALSCRESAMLLIPGALMSIVRSFASANQPKERNCSCSAMRCCSRACKSVPPKKDEPGNLTERQAYITPTGEREIWANEALYHRLNPRKTLRYRRGIAYRRRVQRIFTISGRTRNHSGASLPHGNRPAQGCRLRSAGSHYRCQRRTERPTNGTGMP